jgi:hypothetical protein
MSLIRVIPKESKFALANERLRNPLKIGRLLRATTYQGIPHIVFCTECKKSQFGMTYNSASLHDTANK